MQSCCRTQVLAAQDRQPPMQHRPVIGSAVRLLSATASVRLVLEAKAEVFDCVCARQAAPTPPRVRGVKTCTH